MARFRPPRVREVSRRQGIDEGFVRRLFKLAARRGDVDEVAQDHFFLAETVVEMASIARELAARMKSAHEAKRFDKLALVAGPKMLGHLRDALGGEQQGTEHGPLGLLVVRGDARAFAGHDRRMVSPSRSAGHSASAATPPRGMRGTASP